MTDSIRRPAAAAALALIAALSSCGEQLPTGALRSQPGGALLVDGLEVLATDTAERQTGKPPVTTTIVDASGFGPPFVAVISPLAGSPHVTGTVELNGRQIVGADDFGRSQEARMVPIEIGSTATFTVTLRGAPGGRLSLQVLGRRLATQMCPDGRPGAFATLAAASRATPAGGTVEICDGSWNIGGDSILQAVTVRPRTVGSVTLVDTTTNPILQIAPPVIRVRPGSAAGTVRVTGFRFETRGRMIVADSQWSRLTIDSNTFVGIDTLNSIHVFARGIDGPGARLDVHDNAMLGGRIGIFLPAMVFADIRRNAFSDFVQAGVIPSGGSGLPGAPILPGGDAVVEDNVFLRCRRLGCLRAFGRNLEVRRNTFDMREGGHAQWGINVSRNAAASPSAEQIIIENNTFLGVFLGGEASLSTSWSFGVLAVVFDGTAPTANLTTVVRGNRITGAYAMVQNVTGAMIATDNVFENGWRTALASDTWPLLVTRNDLLNIERPLAGTPASLNYPCNWWGSASGPTPIPLNVPLTAYSPFATEPIAERPAVSCVP